ncbi:MAG: hypothetical protein TUN42_01950 [Dehalogenimonas sp.]
MKSNSFCPKFTIPMVAIIIVLTIAGCGSNAATTSGNPNANTTSNLPTSSAPATSPTTTPPASTTTAPPTASIPPTTLPPTTPPVTTTTQPPVTYAYSVNVAVKTNVGNYLVNSRGFALYYTTSDRPNYSNLPDETITAWPVFFVPTLAVGSGLNSADFGIFTRDSGVKQITYKGYPLYLSIYDKSSGDTMGNGLGGVWFVVKP